MISRAPVGRRHVVPAPAGLGESEKRKVAAGRAKILGAVHENELRKKTGHEKMSLVYPGAHQPASSRQ